MDGGSKPSPSPEYPDRDPPVEGAVVPAGRDIEHVTGQLLHTCPGNKSGNNRCGDEAMEEESWRWW